MKLKWDVIAALLLNDGKHALFLP